MKKNNLPIEIDPISLAQKGATLTGAYGLRDFPRLKESAKNEDLKAEFELRFERDEERRPIILGRIKVEIDLVCERCNELVRYEFELHPRLAVLISEAQAAHLPEEYDPVISHGESLLLSTLVEDEILLEIPMIPKHEWGLCNV